MAPSLPVAEPQARAWWSEFRRELGMRMQTRGWVIWYLIVERGIKGIGLVIASGYLFANRRDMLGLVERIEVRFDLDVGHGFLQRFADSLLVHLVGLSPHSVVAIALGTLLYGAIEFGEALGLFLRRRWAEYLVVLATGFFIPVEVTELLRRPTLFRFGALVLNIVVVGYLVRKKHLFQFDAGEVPVAER